MIRKLELKVRDLKIAFIIMFKDKDSFTKEPFTRFFHQRIALYLKEQNINCRLKL
jgi:hypothetical protein